MGDRSRLGVGVSVDGKVDIGFPEEHLVEHFKPGCKAIQIDIAVWRKTNQMVENLAKAAGV